MCEYVYMCVSGCILGVEVNMWAFWWVRPYSCACQYVSMLLLVMKIIFTVKLMCGFNSSKYVLCVS